MAQLDLFADAPRHYHDAIRRLGRLDFEGCRTALAAHRRELPDGANPDPIQEAADWLEGRLRDAGASPRAGGRAALRLCVDLSAGRTEPCVLRTRGEVARRTFAALARAGLARMKEAKAAPGDPLEPDLPWAVLFLWADHPTEAREGLLGFLACREPSVRAYLALGDASWTEGRREEAVCACREGFGLDPSGSGWSVVAAPMDSLRRDYQDDPVFPGTWWVVGALLDGVLPAWRPSAASAPVVADRWRRFTRLREAWEREELPPSVVFFAGLFLSVHGALLDLQDLSRVRQLLRRLHPEGYEIHRTQLEAGPP